MKILAGLTHVASAKDMIVVPELWAGEKKQPLDGVRYFDMALPALRTNSDNAIFKRRDKATRAGRAGTRNSMVFFIPPPVYKKTARRFQELRDYREFREKKMMGAVKKQLKTEAES